MLISIKNYYTGAVLAASFLLIIYFCEENKYVLICFIFLLSGCISFETYYLIKIPSRASLRIVEKDTFNTIGSYKGRRVLLKGKISKIQQGKIIDAKGIFSGEREYLKGIIGTYEIREYKTSADDLISKSYELKKRLYNSFRTELGDDDTALIMSLCFGDTEYLKQSQKNDFQNMGVIHAVSVSGFHISLIFMLLESFMGLIPTAVISLLYVIFTGTQAAAVRALIMIITARVSKKLYSNYNPISAISFAGILLLAIKPYYVNDIGFALSFLATLGIILYYKKIRSGLFILPKKINESLSITLSAQLFTVPYISFTLQSFSFGFILGNMILLPLYSVIVVAGNAGLIFSGIHIIFLYVCRLLKYIIEFSNVLSGVILRLSPESIFIGYDIGIAALMIYFSYILYLQGYKKWRLFPVFIALTFVFKCYAFIPEIKYMETEYAECVYIRYKFKTAVICRYDIARAWELQKILKSNPVDKIITNINGRTLIKLDDNLYVKTLGSDGDILQLLYENKNTIIPVKLKNMNNNSANISGYGIIVPKYRQWYLLSERLFEVPQ